MEQCPKIGYQQGIDRRICQSQLLIEVAERAGTRTARIAARAARPRRGWYAAGAFCGHRENAKLRTQLFAFALGTLCLVAAEDQGFKLVLAFLADVFKNRHDELPWNGMILLESICGNFANWGSDA